MNEDSRLKGLLSEWRVEPAPEAGFQRAVWARIAAASRPRGFTAALREWLIVSLPRPLYASALVTLFALSGLIAADLSAARLHRREQVRQERRYIASIDPVAMMDQAPDQGQ